jgi:REP-associated tyrosine transposase
MPRVARIVVPGEPHHITQRGNNHQDVFYTDDDRRMYLELLKKQSKKYGLIIHGYCLMSNHVHIVATPKDPVTLARAVGLSNLMYTQYINRLYSRIGHLWQNRFYSCVLDSEHFYKALRYVERNPVRAGIVGQAWDYPWSSALVHIGAEENFDLLDLKLWRDMSSTKNWQELLLAPDPKDELTTFKSHTRSGHPLVNEAKLKLLELRLGRSLRPNIGGRPEINKK